MPGSFLFRIAKAPLMGKIIGNAFRFCGSVIPVKKVLMNRDVIAFVHPEPCYQNHIITKPEYGEGFTLVANGGKKQEVSQVHFHMYTDKGDPFCDEGLKEIYRDEIICVSEVSGSDEKKHYSLIGMLPGAPGADDDSAYLSRLIQCVAALTGGMDWKNQSCSLVFRHDGKAADKRPVFHFFRA